MDADGCIPVALIASFHRVLALTTDVVLIITAIKESDKLELLEGYKVRTKTNPTIWPIRDVLESSQNAAGGCQDPGENTGVSNSNQTTTTAATSNEIGSTTANEAITSTTTTTTATSTIPAVTSDEVVVNAVVVSPAAVTTTTYAPIVPLPIMTSPMATKPLSSIPPPPVPRNSQIVVPAVLLQQEKQIPAPATVNAISALTQKVEGDKNKQTKGGSGGAVAELADHLSGLAESVKSAAVPNNKDAKTAAATAATTNMEDSANNEAEGMWKEVKRRSKSNALKDTKPCNQNLTQQPSIASTTINKSSSSSSTTTTNTKPTSATNTSNKTSQNKNETSSKIQSASSSNTKNQTSTASLLASSNLKNAKPNSCSSSTSFKTAAAASTAQSHASATATGGNATEKEELDFQFDEELMDPIPATGRINNFTENYSDDDESDYEFADRDINKLLIVAQVTRAPKHEGYDRTADYTSRTKITQDLENVINDGLANYEKDLCQ